MFHHPGKKPSPLENDLLAVETISAHHHPLGTPDRQVETRKGKTAFDDRDGAESTLDGGIDQESPGRRASLLPGTLEIVDEESHGDADLRGSHRHSLLSRQRVPEILDNLPHLRGTGVDRLRRSSEKRVEMGDKGSNGHCGLSPLSPRPRFGTFGRAPPGNRHGNDHRVDQHDVVLSGRLVAQTVRAGGEIADAKGKGGVGDDPSSQEPAPIEGKVEKDAGRVGRDLKDKTDRGTTDGKGGELGKRRGRSGGQGH